MATEAPIPIAIVGMSCRFPAGANNLSAFWSMLLQGKSGWSTVPEDRFNEEAFHKTGIQSCGTIQHHGGHFLDQDIRTFDAGFFGITPSEAKAIDPQQRLQLESTYEALEGAGISLKECKGSNTAVYMAMFSRDYDRMMFKDTSDMAKYHMTGVGDAILANRVSYVFDLKGPSVTLDTGCSGSLVALHQACQSLRTNESDMALVGGANLILSPDAMIPLSMASVLNVDGRCYPFDTRGRGYGRGEGVATLVLKRLDDALSEGLDIRAIVRSSGVNQDGKTPGITVPSSNAQQALISSVYASAGIDPSQVGYIEAHGTGTEVGDAAEMETIAKVFCGGRSRPGPLYVGSVKSNIGHLENVSGLAGLIKSVLILENAVIPLNADLKETRMHPEWEKFGIQVPNSNVPWPDIPGQDTRYASVNSFGYGGTNSHCILEVLNAHRMRHRDVKPSSTAMCGDSESKVFARSCNGVTASIQDSVVGISDRKCELMTVKERAGIQIFPFSAQSEACLRSQLSAMSHWISKNLDGIYTFLDLAHTLSACRTHMTHRHSVVATNFQGLITGLDQNRSSFCVTRAAPAVTFIFTGQGAQWFAMGRDLIDSKSVFAVSLARSAGILRALGATWDLIRELRSDLEVSRIDRSEIAQPCTTAIQIALVEFMEALGVQPSTVIGHSSGEIAAAYAAGAISQTAALKVAFHRGLVSKICDRLSSSRGAMLAVGLGESATGEKMSLVDEGHLTVACVNSPMSTTVSGDERAICHLKNIMDESGIFNRKLNVDLAYHSDLIKNAASEYQFSLQGLEWTTPKRSVHFISTVTTQIKNENFDPSYWAENLTSKVNFRAALERFRDDRERYLAETDASDSLDIFLEIGPHSALSSAVRQTYAANRASFKFAYEPTLIRGQQAAQTIRGSLAKLFEYGITVDLGALNLLVEPSIARFMIKDLPCYQWDHSLQFWHESRLSAEHRQRRFPPHDLLGLPIIGNAPFEHVWSNFLSIKEHPWMQDHKIDGFITFPGAAYLCMVLEALKQVLSDHWSAETFPHHVFRNVSFLKALVLPDTGDKIEIQLKMKQSQHEANRSTTGLWAFQIYSLPPKGAWSENCRGSVMAEMQSAADGVEIFNEDELQAATHREAMQRIEALSQYEVSPKKLYDELRSTGNDYGGSFTLLNYIRVGDLDAIAQAKVSELTSKAIHPTTLDALLHLIFPVFARHHSAASIVPVRAKDIFISNNFPKRSGSTLKVGATICPRGPRSFVANVVAFNDDGRSTSEPVFSLTADFQAIGEVDELSSHIGSAKMAWNVEYAEDVAFLGKNWLASRKATLPSHRDISPESKHLLLKQATAQYIAKCLDDLSLLCPDLKHPHMAYLLDWMQRYASSAEFQHLLSRHPKSEDLDAGTLGVEGEALYCVGRKITSIVRGKENPLELLLENDLLYRLYRDDSTTLCCQRLVEYLKTFTFKYQSINVLEIGAGTGGTTLPVLQALSESDSKLLKCYDFTDIAPSFFESAQNLLMKWIDIVSFKTLDIEGDLVEQGFQAGSYDLIIAANVLHATSPIENSLSNVRKLLKPGGKLALIEITTLVPYVNLIFGTLPGWWRGHREGRVDGPQMTVEEWSVALRKRQMTGVDLVAHDFQSEANKTSLMISTATDQKLCSIPQIVILDCKDGMLEHEESTQMISSLLRSQNCTVTYSSWQTEQFDPHAVYLVLDSCYRPILHEASEERFRDLTRLIGQSTNVFWAVLPGDSNDSALYEAGLVTGVSRTARSENESLKLITLDASQTTSADTQSISEVMFDILAYNFATSDAEDISKDVEYVYADGLVLIPRLVPDTRASILLDTSSGHAPITQASFHHDVWPQKLDIGSLGLLDSLRFVDDEGPKDHLGADELEIRAVAHGINFKDVFIALGQMPVDIPMAGECAGIVTSVGSNFQSVYSPGDRVCALNAIPYASRPRLHGLCAHKIPDDMLFSVAASIPVAFATAYHCLIEVAHLQKGHTILIHAASGGVGQAAIMIAQYIGAEIFATVGSKSKREILANQYRIPESHIFSSRAMNFKRGVLRMTSHRGVDVVLNSTSGQALLDTWECISGFGTFVEIGKTDIYRNSNLNMQPFDRNVSFSSVDLTYISRSQPARVQVLLVKIFDLFKSGHLRPLCPITTMAITDIEGAFRLVQSRSHIGKLVLESKEDTVVKSIDDKQNLSKLDPNGTYVIAGGLGALGLKLCHFLGRLGAGHIVVLSRQTPSESANLMFDELKVIGTSVLSLQCDITDSKQVLDAACYCRRKLPPVKGVINGAMVLKDVILEQMSAQDLNDTVRCKTVGTKNLDIAFSNPSLRLFILLSSLTSIIGNRAQASYAAGNAYLDLYAHFNNRKGVSYQSINLGFIADSETISNHPERAQNLIRVGCIPMTFDQVLKVLGRAMSLESTSNGVKQLVVGLNGHSLSRGVTKTIQRAMFSHLRFAHGNVVTDAGAANSGSLTETLRLCKDEEQLHRVITDAIKRQVFSIMALETPDLSLRTSLTDLGLDSLAAVELKNWISRTLHAPLQTGEIIDCGGIEHLAKLVTQRSRLVAPFGLDLHDARSDPAVEDVQDPRQPHPEHSNLPEPPLPDLGHTLGLYKNAVEVFCSSTELERVEKSIHDIMDPDGLGFKLQKRLEMRTQDPDCDSWLWDIYSAHAHLGIRAPINPFQHFYGSHFDGPIKHSQAERAAIVSKAAFTFRSELHNSLIMPDYLHDKPLCMRTLDYLFNTAREPRRGTDKLQKSPAQDDYMVVMKSGLYFQVFHHNRSGGLSLASLIAVFQSICNEPIYPASSVAALTAADRDTWAEVREIVQNVHQKNRRLLQVIDRAAFILCLDEGSPSNATERNNIYLYGHPGSRWSDKSIQFVVCKNGASAYIGDHAALDGGTLLQLNQRVRRAISGYRPENPRLANAPIPEAKSSISPLGSFVTNELIDGHVTRTLQLFASHSHRVELLHHRQSVLGSKFFRSHKCAPKSGYQLTIQLAALRYFGFQPPSWESVQMRVFRNGRAGMYQAVLRSVADFCAAMQDRPKSVTPWPQSMSTAQIRKETEMSENRSLFNLAAKQHASLLASVYRGYGLTHHLYALQEVVRPDQGETMPSLFTDPTYARTRPAKLMTDCAEWLGDIQEGSFAMADPDFVLVHYEIGCRFMLQAPEGRVEELANKIDEAAEQIKELLECT